MAILTGLWCRLIKSSMGLFQSFPSKRGGKARPWTGFPFTVQKKPVPGSSGQSLAKRPHFESGNEICPSSKKSAGGSVSTSFANTRRKGTMGVGTPDVLQPPASSSSSAVFQIGMLFKFFDQRRSITSNRFVLNMVCGHHIQLRSHPPLFYNFQQFNVKAAVAHHPIIQKEVVEVLAKEAIEPSSGGAGFYSSMYVVPKCTGDLQPILNVKHCYHYMHILSFKMPTIRHIWQLIQHGDYAFSIDLQDAYLHIPIVKHHHCFLQFVWHSMLYQWKVLLFGLATVPRVFTGNTKPVLFLYHLKGFHIVIYLDNILVQVHSKWAGKRTCSFLCSLLVLL